MKKSVAFITSGLEFNGNSLIEKSLGGSESAMIYMAREMSKLGNDVTVYCECDKPGIYDNVDYRHCHTFMKDNKSQFDVCIFSRFTHFLANPIDSKLNILWIHDTGVHNPELTLTSIDKIFCLSDFQKGIFVDRYKIDPKYFWSTSNGFDSELVVDSIPFEAKKNNYIYASRPERGLNKLLVDIWPKILEFNPNAVLNICGYKNPHAEEEGSYLKEYYTKTLDILENSKNVINHGELSKKNYYKLLSDCAYMAYPCNFPEISCINAIEAQASGCLVITSDAFALKETVKSDSKINIEKLDRDWDEDIDHLLSNKEYDETFINLIKKYQGDVYEGEVNKVKELIQPYSWNNIAKSWNEKIDSMFIERSENNKERILEQLVYMSDIVAAKEITNEEKYQKLVKKSLADNNIEDTYRGRNNFGTFKSDRITTIINILKNNIPTLDYKAKVLDIGSHDGEISYQLLEKLDFCVKKLYAYDACLPALKFFEKGAKEKFNQIEIIHDNALNVDKHNLDVNFVIVGEILEHIEDSVSFLNKLMSLVKEKTIFVFTTPSGPWDNVEKNKPKIEHMHHFELNDIKEIFKDTDLTIIRPDTTHYGRRGELMGHWVYYFSVTPDNIPNFYKPDYKDKFIKTRPYKKISASMIVKDEENNLSRCIKSFYNFVDELVIVDTGSSDSTKEIASRYTDKIYDYKWEEEDGLGNFSAARNYSLSKCTGDYILWMDADEELINGRLLHNFITSDYYDSILVHQKHCIVYGDPNDYDSPYHDRLFKNNGIHFVGVVHEYPTTDEGWIQKGLFQDMTFIAHYGTINRPARNERIENRYFDLIVKNYKQRPDFLMAQYYYMGLLCTIVEKRGELSLVPEILELWNNKILPTKDVWLLKNSLGFIQGLYKSLFENEIELPYGKMEIRTFQNDTGKTINLAATSEEEFDMFIDIMSNKEITR